MSDKTIMTDEAMELALAAAQDLEAELGFDVEKATQMEINGEQPDDVTRAFGVPEAMAIGSFMITAAQFAWNMYSTQDNKVLVLEKIVSAVEKGEELPDENLTEEKRLQVIGAFVNRMMPDSAEAIFQAFGEPDQPHAAENSADWMDHWEEAKWLDMEERKTASATILLPFADMKEFAVYKSISWSPPADAPAQLPPVIKVEQGFITDLASIPRVFWWLVPPMGRYGHAAILHDWLYWQQTTSRRIADLAFIEVMKEQNVSPPLRTAMWAAVRMFGGKYWLATQREKRRGEQKIIRKFPDSPHYTWEEWKKQPGVFG